MADQTLALMQVGTAALDVHLPESQAMYEDLLTTRELEIADLKKNNLILNAYAQYSNEVILSGLTPVTYGQYIKSIWNGFPLC